MTEYANILIAGTHDFVTPYLYRAASEHFGSDTNVWMLGTGPLAGISVDLATVSPSLAAVMELVIYADGSDSSHLDCKTAEMSARNLLEALEAHPPRAFVYISSVEVYGCEAAEAVAETKKPVPSTPYGKEKLSVEKLIADWCDARAVPLSILRPAPVVGTGMGAQLRQTVNRIYRGTYRHIAGDEARCSVVHAVDVARVATLIPGHAGVFNLTDGVDPTRHALAEALCSRLERKRIFTLPLKKLKIMARIGDILPVTGYDSRRLRAQLSTLTFDSSRLAAALPGFTPVSVTDYLVTHVYDSDSL